MPRRLWARRCPWINRWSRSESVKYPLRSSGGISVGNPLSRSRSVSFRNLPGIRATLGQVTVEGGPADPERPADVGDGVRLVVVQREGLGLLLRVQLPRSAALLPAGPGRVEPGPGPLADEVPLELGQGREDVEDQLPAAGRRVDTLLEASEADLPFLELPHGLDQVPDAATQAVELPDHEGVPLPEVCEGLIEPRPRGTCTTGLVREEPLATGALQGISLEIEALLEGGDAGIADQHGQHPPLGWMVPKLGSHVKVTGCYFRDGFQDGILAVLRGGQGAARGVPKRGPFWGRPLALSRRLQSVAARSESERSSPKESV